MEEPPKTLMLLLSFLSLALAFLSWKYIETPFRDKQFKINQKTIFTCSSVGILCFVSLGIYGTSKNGFIERTVFEPVRIYQEAIGERASGFKFCKKHSEYNAQLNGNICKIGDVAKEPVGLLWGDSYAGSALFGLHNELKAKGKAFYVLLSDGCPPLPGISRKRNAFGCTPDKQQFTLNWFLKQKKLRDLIWVGRFQALTDKNTDNDFFIDGLKPNLKLLEKRIIEVSNQVFSNGKRILFVMDGPNFNVSIPDYLSKARLFNSKVNSNFTTVKVNEQRVKIALSAEFLSEINGLKFIDSLDLFCGP